MRLERAILACTLIAATFTLTGCLTTAGKSTGVAALPPKGYLLMQQNYLSKQQDLELKRIEKEGETNRVWSMVALKAVERMGVTGSPKGNMPTAQQVMAMHNRLATVEEELDEITEQPNINWK